MATGGFTVSAMIYKTGIAAEFPWQDTALARSPEAKNLVKKLEDLQSSADRDLIEISHCTLTALTASLVRSMLICARVSLTSTIHKVAAIGNLRCALCSFLASSPRNERDQMVVLPVPRFLSLKQLE